MARATAAAMVDDRPATQGRTDVAPMKADDAPSAWQPTLRLMEQLSALFPGEVIDVEEVHAARAANEEL